MSQCLEKKEVHDGHYGQNEIADSKDVGHAEALVGGNEDVQHEDNHAANKHILEVVLGSYAFVEMGSVWGHIREEDMDTDEEKEVVKIGTDSPDEYREEGILEIRWVLA